jgi:hypothetical protein
MYRNRDKEFREFFVEDDLMVFCKDIAGLVTKIGVQNNYSKQWRLFIDSSKRNLKALLLHIGNELASIPIAYSVHLKETYSSMKALLQNVKYEKHQWLVCGDFEVIGILLGQQTGTPRCLAICVNGTVEHFKSIGVGESGLKEKTC